MQLTARLLTSVFASAVGLASLASASPQNDGIEAPRLVPVRIQKVDLSELDGRRNERAARAGPDFVSQPIYDNTATWCGGDTFLPLGPGQLVIDEGRVPISGQAGTSPCYVVDLVTFGYVTYVASGAVDIDVMVFDTHELPDPCSTLTPYASQPPLMSFDSSDAGFPLPGSTTVGLATAWIVSFSTSFTMNGGGSSGDLFHWGFRANNGPTQGGGNLGGPLIRGEPATDTGGANTFGVPGAVDCVYGGPVGHGLDTQDHYWFEGSTKTCKDFGGYPSGPFASFYLQLASSAPCPCAPPPNITTYCTAKVSPHGCVPTLTTAGTPSSSSGTFNITVNNDAGKSNAYIEWSAAGPNATPFGGGFRCVSSPWSKTTLTPTNGTKNGCDGSIVAEFNALTNGPSWCGVTVYAQSRCSAISWGGPNLSVGFTGIPSYSGSLSAGLRWTVGP